MKPIQGIHIKLSEGALEGSEEDWSATTLRRVNVASEGLLEAATVLAEQLSRMVPYEIPMVVGEPLLLGDVHLSILGDGALDYSVEAYSGILRVGCKEVFAKRVVWHILRSLGYRQWMPDAIWEHVPEYDRLVFVDGFQHGYQYHYFGNLGDSGNVYPPTREKIDGWKEKNGVMQTAAFWTGHSWGAIINRYPELDDPQYHAAHKLNVLEPLVQQRAIDFAKWRIDTYPEVPTVSMSASDGTAGWEQSSTGEHLLYNPSDRNIILANVVQEALLDDTDPKYHDYRVFIYAYAGTSVKPTVSLHPKVMVGVTDGYYKDGQSWDKVIEDYREVGAQDLYPYIYWAVQQWHWSEPGRLIVGKKSAFVGALQKSLGLRGQEPQWRLNHGEGGPTWANGFLGYLAWASYLSLEEKNTDPAEHWEETLEAFVIEAFPESSEVMSEYFRLCFVEEITPSIDSGFLNQCYSLLLEALDVATAEIERKRIAAFGKYIVFLDLKHAGQSIDPANAGFYEAWEEAMRWVWLIRQDCMIDWRGWLRSQPAIWSGMKQAFEDKYGYAFHMAEIEEGKPWSQEDEDLSVEGIKAKMLERLPLNPPLPFEVRTWSADPLDLVRVTEADPRGRGTTGYFRPDRAPGTEWFFKVTQPIVQWRFKSGLVSNRATTFKLVKLSGGIEEEVYSLDVPGDGVWGGQHWHEYSLSLEPGELYTVHFVQNEGGDGCQIDWWYADGTGVTLMTVKVQRFAAQNGFLPTNHWYFYVPPGIEEIAGFWSGGNPHLENPDTEMVLEDTEGGGKRLFSFNPVPEDTGKVWRIRNHNAGTLKTVPQYLAQHPTELLIPFDALGAQGE